MDRITWRASFPGLFSEIYVDGSALPAEQYKDPIGNIFSYIDIFMPGRSQKTAVAK